MNEGLLIVLVAIVGGALRVSTPFMFVALGECLTEKSGRVNLGLEGTLVLGAIVTVVFGRISDSVGRRPVLVTACVLLLLFSYPAFLLLGSGPLGAWLGQFVLWFIIGMFSGAIPAAFSELFPTRYRAAGSRRASTNSGVLLREAKTDERKCHNRGAAR